MWSMTNPTVTREEVWCAFRRVPDVRLHERSQWMLLLMDGKSCPAGAPWVSRDEETIRSWVHAFHTAGRQGVEHASSPDARRE
jgi:hypothetical protein